MVKLLLGLREVNPGKPNRDGQTPLWGGHEEMVKMLAGRDGVNPNTREYSGLTPILPAAWKGHEGVVKILFRWDEVNPDESGHGRSCMLPSVDIQKW